jgi:hypothetical protein
MIFVARQNIFSFAGETKMATVLARFLSPWPLGWITATPNGRINIDGLECPKFGIFIVLTRLPDILNNVHRTYNHSGIVASA